MSRGSKISGFSVSMAQETAEYLRESITRFLEPYTCTAKFKAPLFPEDECIDKPKLDKELQRILKDSRINAIESPKLFQIAKKLAGDDLLLSRAEAEYTTLSIALAPIIKVGEALPTDAKPSDKENPPKFRSDSPLFNPIQSLLTFFEADSEKDSHILAQLAHTERSLETIIAELEARYEFLREKYKSYFYSLRPSNLMGIGNWLENFGQDELLGLQTFLSKLREIKSNLDSTETMYETGYFDPSHPAVRAFIDSPFGGGSQLDEYLTEDESTISSDVASYHTLMQELIDLAVTSGAVSIAIYFSNSLEKTTGKVYTRGLPSGVEQIIEGPVTDFADAFLGVDELLLLATAGLAGKALAKFATSRKIVRSISEKLGESKAWIVPGYCRFAATMGTYGIRETAKDLGIEAVKFGGLWAVGSVAEEFGLPHAARITASLYVFVFSARIAYLGEVGTLSLASMFEADINTILTSDFLPSSRRLLSMVNDRRDIMQLAGDVIKVSGRRSFRLPKGISPEAAANKIMRLRNAIADYDRQMASLGKNIQAARKAKSEIDTLIVGNPGLLPQDELSDAVRTANQFTGELQVPLSLSNKPDIDVLVELSGHVERSGQILSELRRQLGSLQGKLGQRRTLASRASAKQPPAVIRKRTRESYQPSERVPKRTATPAQHKPSDVAKITGERVLPASEGLLKNLPNDLTHEIIQVLSRGHVRLGEDGAKIIGWYGAVRPGHRRAFLRIVRKFADSPSFGRNWTQLKMQSGQYRARIGKCRLIAEKNNGNVLLKSIEWRRSVYKTL